MNQLRRSYPALFVWGQLIGTPTAGYTIVLHSENLEAVDAEQLRHHIVGTLQFSPTLSAGQVFYSHPRDHLLIYMVLERSVKPQVGRNHFPQETHVVWDADAFQRNQERFWEFSLPTGEVYSSLKIVPSLLARPDLDRADLVFLANILHAHQALILSVIDAILRWGDPVSLAASDSIVQDAAFMCAVHLLLPSSLRRHITFSTNLDLASDMTLRVRFLDEKTSPRVGLVEEFQPVPLSGYRLPDYASLLYHFLDTHSSPDDLAYLVSVVSTLPFSDSWLNSNLAQCLSAGLWDRIGIQLVHRLQQSDCTIDLDTALLALKATGGNEDYRKTLIEWALDQFVTSKQSVVVRSIHHLAIAIRSVPQLANVCLVKLPLTWQTHPDLLILLCDDLVSEPGVVGSPIWNEFIIPLITSVNFPENQHISTAAQWLASQQIQPDHFFQICDAKAPYSLYDEVVKVLHQGHITDASTLIELSQRHVVLDELKRAFQQLETQETKTALQEITQVAEPSRPAFIILLLEVSHSRLPVSQLPHALAVINRTVDNFGPSHINENHARQLLTCFHAITNAQFAVSTPRELLHLGQQLGLKINEILASFSPTAQLRYYVDRCVNNRSVLDHRQVYRNVLGDLIIQPEVALHGLSKEELRTLHIMYKAYDELDVVLRIEATFREVYGVEPGDNTSTAAHSSTLVVTSIEEATSIHSTKSADNQLIDGMSNSPSRSISLPCPVCGKAASASENVRKCPNCGRVYHISCWEKKGQCIKCECQKKSRLIERVKKYFSPSS